MPMLGVTDSPAVETRPSESHLRAIEKSDFSVMWKFLSIVGWLMGMQRQKEIAL
jgi:hypothetical protein